MKTYSNAAAAYAYAAADRSAIRAPRTKLHHAAAAIIDPDGNARNVSTEFRLPPIYSPSADRSALIVSDYARRLFDRFTKPGGYVILTECDGIAYNW